MTTQLAHSAAFATSSTSQSRVDRLPEEKLPTTTRLAIIATKGSLDWAYPPLMMAVQAANKGWDVGIFFTFYGLNIIHKEKNRRLKVAPVGNPAMPVPIPNLIAALPGMTAMATWMVRRNMRKHGVPTIEQLVQQASDASVKLFPCGFTIDVFDFSADDFIDGIEQRCGSPHFLEFAKDADMTIFV